ncbi:MAG: Bro-N domain-containing protein [Nanoarchaeota archaeon]|nr:Bro-N domain-containing protein [Nanoarchaeota archaeon]
MIKNLEKAQNGNKMDKNNALVVFQDKKIRRKWFNDKWWFSVVDVIAALTDSPTPRQYWGKVKDREFKDIELSPIWVQLKLRSADGKLYATDCANTESMFRIIQSIPSKKAEPFKQWLAKVGYERVQEIENPELAQDRAKEYYGLKGYPKDWIDKRLRGIAVRQALTEEWSKRGIEEKREYAILTNEISEATFGVGIKDHKKIKRLDPKYKNQNLRDHMTDLELIFNMLGEASTTEIAKKKDTQGFKENKFAAKEGGKIAGDARKKLELKTGNKVVSETNYIDITKKKSLKRPKKSDR